MFITLLFLMFHSLGFCDSSPAGSVHLETLQKTIIRAVQNSKGAQAGEFVFDILRQKLKTNTWVIDNYPKSSEEMRLKPRLKSSVALASDVVSVAPRWTFLEHRSGGVCTPLPVPGFSGLPTPPECLNSSTEFSPDNTKLASLERNPRDGSEQRGYISFVNLDLLSDLERSQLFSDPQFVLPETSRALQSVPIEILAFVAEPNSPEQLKSIRVQAGNLVGEVPVKEGGALPLQYVESGTGRIIGLDVASLSSRQLASLSCPQISINVLGCTGVGSASCTSPKISIGRSTTSFCKSKSVTLGHFINSEVSFGLKSFLLTSAGSFLMIDRSMSSNPSSLWRDPKIMSVTYLQGSWYALRSDGALFKSDNIENQGRFVEVPCLKLEGAESLVSDELLCL